MKMDKPMRHVVTIGFDDSSGSRLALRWAATEAARRSDQLVERIFEAAAVVKGYPEQWAGRVVVAVDGQMESRWLLSAGSAEAQRRRQPLTVLTCTWAPELCCQWLDLPSNDRDGHGAVGLGSLASKVVEHARGVVLVVPRKVEETNDER